jgi:GT2 family glycosyltransferase
MPSLSIVVLTHNRKDALQELLEQLVEFCSQDCEVIVVDNGSRDGTDVMVRTRYAQLDYVALPQNVGVGARNHGLRLARGSIIVCLDDDILGLTARDLDYLRRAFAADPQLGALCFKVIHHHSSRVCDWVHHRRIEDSDLAFLTYEITEGAVAFRREALAQAGYYFEEFFISHEGLDLAYRLMNCGYHLRYDGSITVRHKHEKSGRTNWRRHYYDTRNLLWVAARNQPVGYALKYLVLGLAAMAVYAVRDGVAHYWLRAVHDGLHRLPEMLRLRQPWSASTRALCRQIDAQRPGFWYLARRRISQRGFKMD